MTALPAIRDVSSDPRAAALPRVLWIELTSKCPFDCVFCSRRLRRGDGEHMQMALYRSLLAELQSPEIVRLNYSGESTHHPHLLEAVELASRTGASTELVTALTSLPDAMLEGLVTSGLERLTVSLHTLDPEQYRRIYGFGTVADLQRKLAALVRIREQRGARTPRLDFAFVAMADNLDQLPAVAAYARRLGIEELAVHPVIRRDPIAATFATELDGGRLRPEFVARLRRAVRRTRWRHPRLRVQLSTPELEKAQPLSLRPCRHAAPLPAGARIAGCDQDPFETVHVLSNGAVVACEVQDRIVLGSLQQQSLAEIWHGESYRAFRDRYAHGAMSACRDCPYKVAHLPAAPAVRVVADGGYHVELTRGWHAPGRGRVRWSKREAVAELGCPTGARWLVLQGRLPSGPNRLHVACNGTEVGSVVNEGPSLRRFRVKFPFAGADGSLLRVDLRTEVSFRPGRSNGGPDLRELGFGLVRIAVES